jgi:hypothetical protein
VDRFLAIVPTALQVSHAEMGGWDHRHLRAVIAVLNRYLRAARCRRPSTSQHGQCPAAVSGQQSGSLGKSLWGHSSVGRALERHTRGRQGGYVMSFSPDIHTSPFCSGTLLSQRLNSCSASRWAWPWGHILHKFNEPRHRHAIVK